MSLTVAFKVAQKGISLTEKRLAVISSNVNNASTAGYTRKVYQANIITTSGITMPVGGSVVQAAVNTLLLKNVNKQATYYAYNQLAADYLLEYSDSYGSTSDDGYNLSTSLNSFTASLQAAEENPSDGAAKLSVVSTAQQIASQLNGLSQNLQNQRLQVNNDIDLAVDTVNDLLKTISELNVEITEAQSTNSSVADLEDQRNTALLALSELMGIQYFSDDNDQVKVYSSTGVLLSSGTYHATLSYDPVGTVSSDTSYPGGFDGINLAGADITSALSTGKLGAMIALRDSILPDEQEKLDEIATVLSDTINAFMNQGTTVPPRNSMTGYTVTSSGAALGATGMWRVAVADEDGVVQSYADIDLSTLATVGDLVSALNGIAGISASVDADGHLVVTSTNSDHGIAINEMDSDIGGVGAAHFFGLNNLFEGNNGNPITASNIQLSAFLQTNATLFPTGALSNSATLAVGDNGVTKGDGSIATAMLDALNGTLSFSTAGDFSARNATLSSYVNALISNAATKASSAQTNADTAEATFLYLTEKLSDLTGVNVDEETANMTQLQTYYEANATMMSTIREMFQALIDAVRS